MSRDEAKKFGKEATKWMRYFTDICQSCHVTPYIHILKAHIAPFLKEFGSLAVSSQQRLEKLNNEMMKVYFKSTNHHNRAALDQMMLKFKP